MLKEKNTSRGQSTVEYIILFAAVISFLLYFFSEKGPFRGSFNQTMSSHAQSMPEMTKRFPGFRKPLVDTTAPRIARDCSIPPGCRTQP